MIRPQIYFKLLSLNSLKSSSDKSNYTPPPSVSIHKLQQTFRPWPWEQMLGESQHSAMWRNSGYTIGAQQPMGDVVLRKALYNQQWTPVFPINELQFPECWYPESWKGLEWHLLNPGAQILATAQSSESSAGVKHHNKCSLSGFHNRLGEWGNMTRRPHICNLTQLNRPKCNCQTWYFLPVLLHSWCSRQIGPGYTDISISWHPRLSRCHGRNVPQTDTPPVWY